MGNLQPLSHVTTVRLSCLAAISSYGCSALHAARYEKQATKGKHMRLFQYGLTALALSSLLFATACDCKKEAVDENTPASAVVAEEQAAVADDAQRSEER